MDQARRLKRLGKLAATFLGKDRQDIGTSHLLTSNIQIGKFIRDQISTTFTTPV